MTVYLLLPLFQGNQLLHPLQEDIVASFTLFRLVLGFGEGHLLSGGD